MGERYEVQPKDCDNNSTYPWRIYDHGDSRFVAFLVTEHTAKQYCQQLNVDGYVSAL